MPRCSPERVCAPPLEDYLKSSSCILNLPESISSLLYVTSASFRTRITEEMFLHLLILSLIVLPPSFFHNIKTKDAVLPAVRTAVQAVLAIVLRQLVRFPVDGYLPVIQPVGVSSDRRPEVGTVVFGKVVFHVFVLPPSFFHNIKTYLLYPTLQTLFLLPFDIFQIRTIQRIVFASAKRICPRTFPIIPLGYRM